MAAPQKATPRWNEADADETKTSASILPDPAAACRAAEARDKRFTGVRARAAHLAGIELYIITDETGRRAEYLAQRWGWTKTFPDLASVETWLQRVTGGAQ